MREVFVVRYISRHFSSGRKQMGKDKEASKSISLSTEELELIISAAVIKAIKDHDEQFRVIARKEAGDVAEIKITRFHERYGLEAISDMVWAKING